ncbi:caspase recruitment domain-containing protein 19 [Callorhinchus milii]|uniref:caspase recruitment domain-containing protein 19 n=1 Tax=Callorhinchus milii TaxID=7868 RepID=UPI001C3FBB1D|nr:caspase recruitment domain-containing protein 19 [Callorhinchus milii]
MQERQHGKRELGGVREKARNTERKRARGQNGWECGQSVDTMADHCRRLKRDSAFLTGKGNLDPNLVDKIVLHLYRIYPQILNETEAEKFRNLQTPLGTRISELLDHLPTKNNRACKEFYNALELNNAQVYASLPSRKSPEESTRTPAIYSDGPKREKYVLNNRDPMFFLACFSVAAGLALFMYYCKEDTKFEGTAKKILGFSTLGVGRQARRYLLAYLEDQTKGS